MSRPTKWWLISDDDVQAIRKGLTGDLLHTLSSGLHTTDEIPDDWKDTVKKNITTVKYIGCNLDLCPKEHGRLCCFDCADLAKCGESGSVCDERDVLLSEGKTQFECGHYQSSAPSTKILNGVHESNEKRNYGDTK